MQILKKILIILVELLGEIERDDTEEFPEESNSFPPENANDQCDTDEDSGDDISNLPKK